MISKVRKFAAVSSLFLSAVATVVVASPASAEVADPGIDINQDSPNYDITIHCDNLPYNGQESYTGLTQHGSYTIHADDACVNGSGGQNYLMQVDDNGDTDEIGGYTVNGVTAPNSGWISIPATFTLKPDTYVTIKKDGGAPTDYYNIRYNGSDPNQLATQTNSSELGNTGFDSLSLGLIGGLLAIIGAASVAISRKRN